MLAEGQEERTDKIENVYEFGRRRALQLIQEGLNCSTRGMIPEAKRQFQRSIDLCPTAEGYTFLGWMLSMEGSYQEAIALCAQAIEIDPEFGNPYNDIGTNLVSLGRPDEAITWFEKAIKARRYGPRQFPHMNLGRIYFSQGKLASAEEECRKALALDPGNSIIHAMLARIKQPSLTDILNPP